jgi:hypothetical protein
MLKPMELFFGPSKWVVVEIGIEVIKPQVIVTGPGKITEWLAATCSILLTALLQNMLCPASEYKSLS